MGLKEKRLAVEEEDVGAAVREWRRLPGIILAESTGSAAMECLRLLPTGSFVRNVYPPVDDDSVLHSLPRRVLLVEFLLPKGAAGCADDAVLLSGGLLIKPSKRSSGGAGA